MKKTKALFLLSSIMMFFGACGCQKTKSIEWLPENIQIPAWQKTNGDFSIADAAIKYGDVFFVIANEKIYAENLVTGEKTAICGQFLNPYGIGEGRIDLDGHTLFWTGMADRNIKHPECGFYAYDMKTGKTDQILHGYEITEFCVQDDMICFTGAKNYTDFNTIENGFGIYSISKKEITYWLSSFYPENWFWVDNKIYGIVPENNRLTLCVFDVNSKEQETYPLQNLTEKKCETLTDIKISVSEHYIAILSESEELAEQEKCIDIFDRKTLQFIVSLPRMERQFDAYSQAFRIFDINDIVYIAQSADGQSVLYRLNSDKTLEECGRISGTFNAYDFKIFNDGIYAMNRLYNGEEHCFFDEHAEKLFSISRYEGTVE